MNFKIWLKAFQIDILMNLFVIMLCLIISYITTGGRYMLDSHNIEINPKQYQYYGKNALIDIIKHELCHYHLHLGGKGYKHKDSEFKILSKQVGAPRFCAPIQSYEARANYLYKCQSCSYKYLRIRKVDVRKMRCGICNGKLSLIEHLTATK